MPRWKPRTKADNMPPKSARMVQGRGVVREEVLIRAACCNRQVDPGMIVVLDDGGELCDACRARIERKGGGEELYRKLGAPPEVLERIAQKARNRPISSKSHARNQR